MGIQHMIIRKNFGATHFIIGRDMAGTKSTLTSDDFYGAFEAQEKGKKHSEELAVTVVDYPNMVYVGDEGNVRGYASDVDAKAKKLKIHKLSGTDSAREARSPSGLRSPRSLRSSARAVTTSSSSELGGRCLSCVLPRKPRMASVPVAFLVQGSGQSQ